MDLGGETSFGSSGKLMGKSSRREVELAAVEQDSDPVVGKPAEAAGRVLDGLNSAVVGHFPRLIQTQ
jgi:hypothetical protein